MSRTSTEGITNPDGAITIKTPNTVISDGDLENSEASPWQDETNKQLSWRSKDSSGVALSYEVSRRPGYDWVSRTNPEDSNWSNIAYGNNKFVAIANSGTNRVMSSEDGVNWSIHAALTTGSWVGLCYGNGLFVAITGSAISEQVQISVDGETWTGETASHQSAWQDITYGSGLFVAVSATTAEANGVMTSSDGILWKARASAAQNTWSAVCYGNGLFVAVSYSGSGNRVMTSPDGVSWTSRTSAADNNWNSVCFGKGLFVAVASTGTDRVMTSPDGVTWTSRSTPGDTLSWTDVHYGANLFVAVGGSGVGTRVMTSIDGVNWVLRTSAADNIWRAVTYGKGMFVAISATGTGNRIMTSGTIENSEAPHNNIHQGEQIFQQAIAVLNDGASPIVTERRSSSTSSSLRGLEVHRTTTGTSAPGIGVEVGFRIQDSGGSLETAGTIKGILTDTPPSGEEGSIEFEVASDSGLITAAKFVGLPGGVAEIDFLGFPLKDYQRTEFSKFIEDFDAISQTNFAASYAITGATNDVTSSASYNTITTAASAGSSGYTRSLYAQGHRALRTRLECKVKLSQVDADTEFYFDFNTQSGLTHSANDTFVAIAFRKNTSDYWQLLVDDGSGTETQTSSTAATTNDTILEVWVETDGTVHWAIDGVEQSTSSITKVMATSAHYVGYAVVSTTGGGGAAKTALVDFFEMEKAK